MAKHKQRQVPLVSDTGPAQPPLPGGWALAIVDAIDLFAPGFARQNDLVLSRGTRTNINGGKTVKQSTYDEIERMLARIIASLFPRTALVSQCAAKYVNEFFRLWTFSAASAPTWARIHGFTAGESGMLSRALVRDLTLRLCYLESCERKLSHEGFSEWELASLKTGSLTRFYRGLIETQMRRRRLTQIGLGLKLAIDSRRFREFMTGASAPTLVQLQALCPKGESQRLVAGICFFDALLRRLGLNDTGLSNEILRTAKPLLPNHRACLDTFVGDILHPEEDGSIRHEPCGFEGFIAYGEHLLVHPGFDDLIRRKTMRAALWRCHLYSLRFARVSDLAQAYYQFSDDDDDHPLEEMLRVSESESDGSPYGWMEKLNDKNPIVPFTKT